MNITKLVLLALATCFLMNTSIAQDVEWSELVKKKGFYPTLYHTDGKNFYSLVATGALAGKSTLKHYSDFIVDADERVEYKIDGKRALHEGLILIEGKMVLFLSQEENDVQKIYAQIYDESCLPSGQPKFLAEYSNEKGGRGTSFTVVQSENKQFFSIRYTVPAKRTELETFGYKVFNTDLDVVNEGVIDLPFINGATSYGANYVGNSGNFYFGISIYPTNEKGKAKGSIINDYVVCKANGDELEQLELLSLDTDLKGKSITGLNFIEGPTGDLIFTGLFGTGGNSGVEGAFVLRINMQNKEVLSESFNVFEKDFITATWTDRQKKKADKREEKGKGSPEFYNYYLRELRCLADGSILVSMEQFYITVTTYTDSKGNTRTTYHYHYNDVIVYKINPENEFAWVQRIRKYQHSTNDGGYILGIGGYVDANDYVVFFNDNVNNYDEFGKYVLEDSEKISGARASKAKNCVARTKINLETGELEREMFTSRKETDAYCIPQRFNDNVVDKTLLMYFQTHSKEKFGLLRYN